MDVVSACALPVSSWLWRSSPSSWTLTVICRATFLLEPTTSPLAPDQEHPLDQDDHWNDDDGRSLRVASDLVPLKPRADVTLVGHAFAPRGTPVRSLVVRLLVGEIDKVIDVHADRTMGQDGSIEHGSPFSRMPLHYERAAGGPETWNPVGVRGTPSMYGRVTLPNLQPHGLVVASPSDFIAPIGFGPIAPGWPSRREKLGRSAGGKPPNTQTQPLPEDLDRSYFNHAPREQQTDDLRENERIILENLHPDYERLVTSLPGVRPRATAMRRGGAQDVPLRCDTLWIDTDRGVCSLTWRGQVALESPDEEGQIVFSIDGQAAVPEISPPSEEYVAIDAIEDAADTLVPALRSSTPQKPIIPQMPRIAPSKLQVVGAATETLIPAVRAAALAASVLPFSPSQPEARSGERGGAGQGGLPFVTASQSPPLPPPRAAQVPPLPPAPRPRTPAPAPAPVKAAPVEPSVVTKAPSWVSAAPIAEGPIAPALSTSRWSVSDDPGTSGPPPMTVGQLASVSEVATSAPTAAPTNAANASTSAAEGSRPGAKAEAKKAESKVESRRAIQLLWFDRECLAPIRRKPAYQTLLTALEDRPPDLDLEDPNASKRPADMEDRRDVFEIMARGEYLSDEAKLNEAVERALREDGKFIPPFLLIDGEMRLPFDELATLKATISIASPFASGDEGLKTAIAEARELLRNADSMCTPGVYEGFTTLVQEAFRKIRRPSTSGVYLEEQTERSLLERRSYQKREVFGATYVRALLQIGTAQRPWPLYVPEDAGKKLPLFTRFQVRVYAEACLQEDQFELHPIALRAAALSRITPMLGTLTKPAAKA